jgi:hypothetical protein
LRIEPATQSPTLSEVTSGATSTIRPAISVAGTNGGSALFWCVPATIISVA